MSAARTILLLFVLLPMTSALRAEIVLDPQRVQHMEALISAEMAALKIPGLSIAISRGTDLVWSKGFGIADLENKIPVTPLTAFRTASTVKPMTGVATAQLAERGKLNVDASVTDYVKSFSKPFPVTVRQVLGHLAGIRSYKDASESFNTKHFSNLHEAVAVFEADALVHEPGLKMTYSTYGYVLLGAVIEQASGRSYAEYMINNVWIPAGMLSTQIDDVYAIVPNRARGYAKTGDGRIVNAALHDTSGKIPGGGVVSTSEDLVRFVGALDSGKLLNTASVHEVLTSMVSNDGRTTGYGFGWGIEDFQGRKLYGHGGGQAGVSTQLYYLPSEHLGIALMCNLESVALNNLANRLLPMLLQ